MGMQFAIIIQARLGSTRLPGKVLKNYKGYSILNVLVERLKKIKKSKEHYYCDYQKKKMMEKLLVFVKIIL